MKSFHKNLKLRTVGEYAACVLLCLLILTVVTKLWRANLRVPFEYGGDAVFHGMVIKGIIDHGWYLRNNSVGAPGGAELYYFPMADDLPFGICKTLSFFTHDYALIINFYFLLTFPLTTLSSFYVLRHFKISNLVAGLASLLYTFLPYHFLRNEHHLTLVGYYVVPLAVMMVLWVASGRLINVEATERNSRKRLGLNKRFFISSLVISLLIASGGLGYYGFFAGFFLLIGGIAAASYRQSVRHFLAAVVLICAVFAGMMLNLMPNMIYSWRHGESRTVVRGTEEAELYGLKISQLVLPLDHHRIRQLAYIKDEYNRSAPLVNENGNATLGVVGTIGFLTLLGWLMFRRPFAVSRNDNEAAGLFNHLGVLTLSGVLLATIGGFASLFALFVSSQMRSYNRISVYLAFFSLFAVALLLDGPLRRRVNSKLARNLYPVLLVTILLVGIFDQTTKGLCVPQYTAVAGENANDAAFVNRIESTVPIGSMIFQLPYLPFPEGGSVNQMIDYDHFRMYLHSHSLRWSYGTIKGLANDRWQQLTASLPPDQFLEAITLAGFSGVYIDRRGYPDAGADIDAKLRALLRIEPIVSPNGRMLFFDLTEFRKQLEQLSAELLESKRQKFLYPLTIQWTGGFSGLETTPNIDWRWCSSSGELVIENPSDRDRKIKLTMGLATGYEEPSTLSLEGGSLVTEKIRVNNVPTEFSRTIVVAPGRHVIQFSCDARQVNAPLDPRVLVFQILNFKFEETQ